MEIKMSDNKVRLNNIPLTPDGENTFDIRAEDHSVAIYIKEGGVESKRVLIYPLEDGTVSLQVVDCHTSQTIAGCDLIEPNGIDDAPDDRRRYGVAGFWLV